MTSTEEECPIDIFVVSKHSWRGTAGGDRFKNVVARRFPSLKGYSVGRSHLIDVDNI